MAVLGDGDNGVAISMARLDVGVMKGRRNLRLRGRDALPVCVTFAAIDDVAGEVGIDDGLPAEVDCSLGAGSVDGGDSSNAGGDGGWKNVLSLDSNGRGKIAGEFQGVSIDSEADDALGAIIIGLAEANGFVESVAGLRAGVDEQGLLKGLGRRGERALLGLGGGRREKLAMKANGDGGGALG